jgi:hypothetical protein
MGEALPELLLDAERKPRSQKSIFTSPAGGVASDFRGCGKTHVFEGYGL